MTTPSSLPRTTGIRVKLAVGIAVATLLVTAVVAVAATAFPAWQEPDSSEPRVGVAQVDGEIVVIVTDDDSAAAAAARTATLRWSLVALGLSVIPAIGVGWIVAGRMLGGPPRSGPHGSHHRRPRRTRRTGRRRHARSRRHRRGRRRHRGGVQRPGAQPRHPPGHSRIGNAAGGSRRASTPPNGAQQPRGGGRQPARDRPHRQFHLAQAGWAIAGRARPRDSRRARCVPSCTDPSLRPPARGRRWPPSSRAAPRASFP